MILAILFTTASNLLQARTSHFEMCTSDAHDFHYSRLEMIWNPDQDTWQGILRVFTDDLEKALTEHSKLNTPWRLGDSKEQPHVDDEIDKLLRDYLIWFTDTSSTPNNWRFIGKEVDFDLTYLFIESVPVESSSVLKISNQLFFLEFHDQVNEVTVSHHDQSFRDWITKEDPVVAFELIER